jgi:hypothetical protein
MRNADPSAQRYKELLKMKRRLLTQMRKHRKSLAKARVDKKRVNEEITRLRKSGFAFAGLTPEQAQKRVSGEIRAVTPEDIYPKDLERKFDKLERKSEVMYKKGMVDTSDIDDDSRAHAAAPGDQDDDREIYAVTLDPQSGVIDLGDGEEDDDAEPRNEDD